MSASRRSRIKAPTPTAIRPSAPQSASDPATQAVEASESIDAAALEADEDLSAPEAQVDAAAHETRRAAVALAEHGQRLDRWLVALAPEFSRSHLQTLIAEGLVSSGARVWTQPSRRVAAGEVIEVQLRPTAQSTAFRPEAMALDIVHEDEHLMVIHKPAGLVVHPAAGNWSGTLLNGLLAHDARAASLPRAGIVHRLDKDTSGLMVVARTLQAHTALVRAIAAHEVRREYLALAHGAPKPGWRRIDQPLGRDPQSRVRMAIVAGGKPARTDACCLAGATLAFPSGPTGQSGVGAVSAWLCRLHTGRTHQIRVHLASLGHPLLADALYGGRPALGLERQALHAARLSFVHPIEGGLRVFSAALPPDLASAWSQVNGVAGDIGAVIATIRDNE